MGWWSEGIMGGDTPYDIASDVREKIAPSFEQMHMPDHWSEDVIVTLRGDWTRYGGVEKVCDEIIAEWKGHDEEYIVQVVTLLAMSCAMTFSEEFRRRAIEASDPKQAEEQGWCNTEGRQDVLQCFQKIIERYDGNPRSMRQTGLFERIFNVDEDVMILGVCEGDLGIKQFSLPGVSLRVTCPQCQVQIRKNLGGRAGYQYLINPPVGKPFLHQIQCEDCHHEFPVRLRLDITLTHVGETE